MTNLVNQVIEFNKQVLKIDQRSLDMLKANEFEISIKCLKEEIEEFEQAHKNGDIIGCIDSMVDLRYFAIGVLYKMGLNVDSIIACDTAVHEANMTKKLGSVAKRAVDGAADAIKPVGWVSPEERIINILDIHHPV